MYQSFIGLEIHIQLLTKTKVFCGCRAAFGDEPNTNVCPICMGYPGVLPALNEEAIRQAYIVARALNCTLAGRTVFERKNYFYPDLPKNYQISQYGSPIGRGGHIDLEFRKQRKRIRIHDVHLEEDAGKMIHVGDMSLLDYNRAGTPLLEIVTEPDLEIGEESELFLQNFRRMVRYLGVCDGNMEEGSLRCDANVSVNLRGKGLGSKVEIKNLNSSRFVRKALAFEIARHEEILERGGTVLQETRLWNENRDVTESMRTKEEANDYRYFPEPDLPPFTATREFVASVERSLVELPAARHARVMSEYGLSEAQADFICDERRRADFFERVVALGTDPQAAATWLGGDVKKLLNRRGLALEQSPLSPERLAELLGLLGDNRIHGRIAKQTLELVFEQDRDPLQIIREQGWDESSGREETERAVAEVIEVHPDVVATIKKGDERPIGFLVGQVMKRTSGKAQPQLVQELLRARLSERRIALLMMGGAITGKLEGGIVSPMDLGEARAAATEAAAAIAEAGRVSVEAVQPGTSFSEEITPENWAALVVAVGRKLADPGSKAVIVTHGTDTLPYTASLLYWLFADARVPLVLAASVTAGDEARRALAAALRRAARGGGGVSVVIGEREYAPLNLRFERVAPDGFANWNLEGARPGAKPIGSAELDFGKLKEAFERAINRCFVAKVFPGMKGESLIELMGTGVRAFVLELYDTGTANVQSTAYSIRNALAHAREQGVRFFCTSQQQGIVDFSEYSAAHELWKEGAVPMGRLTTESAFTRLVAALVVSDTEEDAFVLMEDIDANAGG